MKMKTIVISMFLTISLLLSIPLASSQEVEDEHEFSYESGAENGPEHWGELNVNWTKCGTGHQQSPIDLLNERVEVNPYLGSLRRSYWPANAIMKNRGYDVELKWEEDAGSIRIDENDYPLIQLHWHAPSEHTISGNRFAMEMHIVHKTPDREKIAVIGFLYKYGNPDPFLDEDAHDNARPIQNIYDRMINMYRPLNINN